jgi:hypothetical protein
MARAPSSAPAPAKSKVHGGSIEEDVTMALSQECDTSAGISNFPDKPKLHFGKGKVTNDLYLSPVVDLDVGLWLWQSVDAVPALVLAGEA